MSAQENIAIIKHIFEQFENAGNLEPFYEAFGDDAVFEVVIPTDLPLPRVSRGPDGLRAYFEQADRVLEFLGWNVHDFLANDARVVAFGDEQVRVRSSGRTLSTRWVMVFRFEGGKIAEMQSYEDMTCTTGRPGPHYSH
jgi:ketosteroid isomerase-like protein